ncbi:hypothetical protein F441_02237 [Phytophthora nicotianae CJ01A1]|uniref:Uncharacterized protein n=2 Tax=Phytophthora nicotianae TaxID=4792 RepID=V9FWA0_PHYNI|nr:hypothetical protein F443_02262 [Phytophthora nicotianae P1569]ETP24830.1 hypothetical protein F441_02237 [Phytophthora nicotianae CJ01A1]
MALSLSLSLKRCSRVDPERCGSVGNRQRTFSASGVAMQHPFVNYVCPSSLGEHCAQRTDLTHAYAATACGSQVVPPVMIRTEAPFRDQRPGRASKVQSVREQSRAQHSSPGTAGNNLVLRDTPKGELLLQLLLDAIVPLLVRISIEVANVRGEPRGCSPCAIQARSRSLKTEAGNDLAGTFQVVIFSHRRMLGQIGLNPTAASQRRNTCTAKTRIRNTKRRMLVEVITPALPKLHSKKQSEGRTAVAAGRAS